MTLPIAILAGGLGTRLWPLTRLVPKCLIEVEGRPFIEYQLDLLSAAGFKDVVVCVGYLGELVEKTLGTGSRWNLDLWYSHDGKQPLGTGGALVNALPLLGETFFVMYGDAFLDCDYAAIARAFYHDARQGLMAIYRELGNVDCKNGEIRLYSNRASGLPYIDYGLSILRAEALDHFPSDTPFELESVWWWLIANKELAAYEVKERFQEIGSPEGLEKFNRYISEKK